MVVYQVTFLHYSGRAVGKKALRHNGLLFKTRYADRKTRPA
ncbi:hypothetical protein [uncultured Bartonella sp.]|nr:hypothetical protein [uncultured Bartonella sp.]